MTRGARPQGTTTTTSPDETLLVHKTLDLACAPDTAFRVFTEEIGRWWPLASHALGAAVDCAVEGWVGGRIFQRDTEGNETSWGRVLAWSPPQGLRFSWHLRNAEELAQEVAVRFTVAGTGTRLTLEHRGFEKRPDEAQALVESYDVGWDRVLAEYRAAADTPG